MYGLQSYHVATGLLHAMKIMAPLRSRFSRQWRIRLKYEMWCSCVDV